MKKNMLTMGSVLLLLLSFSCKQNRNDEAIPSSEKATTDVSTLDVVLPQVVPPGSFTVIAGKYDSPGNIDANRGKARFASPRGIFVNGDGSLLVADYDNSSIRKLVHDTVVTTLQFPPNPDGFILTGPTDVAATKDGTIGIMEEQSRWLYMPNGQFLIYFPGGHNQFGPIDKDPTGTYFWLTDFTQIYAVKPNGDFINTPPFTVDAGGFTAISACLNGVKYLASPSQIYKYTKSGVSARIFTSLTFNNISSIVASKDGYRIYIADGGAIKVISNCPSCTPRVRTIISGVGAESIALSNSEKYLYFTSGHLTVNKLTL